MKKFGFTLMEILMALAIVGVISALTIPTFVNNAQTKTRAATLAAAVSDVENALTTMIVEEEANDLLETQFYTNLNNADNKAQSATNLSNHIKLLSSAASIETMYPEADSRPVLPERVTLSYLYRIKNGAILMVALGVNETDEKFADAWIDSNGTDRPNSLDIDIIKYNIKLDGSLELDEN